MARAADAERLLADIAVRRLLWGLTKCELGSCQGGLYTRKPSSRDFSRRSKTEPGREA